MIPINHASALIGVEEKRLWEAAHLAGVREVHDRHGRAFFTPSHLDRIRQAIPLLPGHRQWYVYIVRAARGPIKIGMARDVKRRVIALQTTAAKRLRLLHHEAGDGKVERAAHKRLAAHRLTGEWFSPHPEVLQFVEIAKTEGFAAAISTGQFLGQPGGKRRFRAV